jgi:hypothetical protein
LEAHVRIVQFVLVTITCIVSLVVASAAQQTPASNVETIKLLQEARAALNPGAPVTDVLLSATAHYIAGSDDETGTANFKAIGASSRIDLNLPSGIRSENRSFANGQPSGTWSGIDGLSHPVPFHNLLTEPAWFFPLFAVSRGLASSGYVATYVGHEVRDNVNVEHIILGQDFSALKSAQSSLQGLSQIDIYLDSSTFLPSTMTFSIHPDDDELLDIPTEIWFTDYRLVNGVRAPFHVQKFLNNSLSLDLQFQNVTINSGLSANDLSIQ